MSPGNMFILGVKRSKVKVSSHENAGVILHYCEYCLIVIG